MFGRKRYGQVKKNTQYKKYPIRDTATDVIGSAGPQKPADHVEYTDHHHVGRREGGVNDFRQRGAKYLGNHRPGNTEYANPCSHIETKDDPQLIELRRLQRLIDVDVIIADQMLTLLFRRRFPPSRFPSGSRQSIRKRGCEHDDEIDEADNEKSLGDAGCAGSDNINALRTGQCHVAHISDAGDDDFLQGSRDFDKSPAGAGNQFDGICGAQVLRCAVKEFQEVRLHRRANHGAATEAHDRHACSHAAAVRKPANQGTDRRHIAKTEATAADNAVA